MTVGYPVRAGGRVQGGAAAVGAAVPPSPPPAPLKVGQTIAVHLASCESPEQHERVALAGEIVLVHDDGAGLAYMADGTWAEVCPWFVSDCPNAVPARVEEQAA